MLCGAIAAGADFVYMGTRFIATPEANAVADYKRMIVDSTAADVFYTPYFTGVHGNYLRPSIVAQGLDPDNLPVSDPSTMNFGGDAKKAWKDIWGCGQGIGAVDKIQSAGAFVAKLRRDLKIDAA